MAPDAGVSEVPAEYADYPELANGRQPPLASETAPPPVAEQTLAPVMADAAAPAPSVVADEPETEVGVLSEQPEKPALTPPDSASVSTETVSVENQDAGSEVVATQDDNQWHALLPQLKLSGMAQQLAEHCLLKVQSDDQIILLLERSGETLRTNSTEEALSKALQQYNSIPAKLSFEIVDDIGETPQKRRIRLNAEQQAAAERSIADDPVIRQLQQKWGGVVIPGSVKPNRDVAAS